MPAVAARAAEAERERLLIAMAEVVGERGYRETRIAEVIATAQSCRASFDRHFADKEECFCAAHERLLERALEVVGDSIDPERPWADRAGEALGVVIALCQQKPRLARAMVVAPKAAGAAGRRCEQEALRRFAELISADPQLVGALPPSATLMAVSGVAALIGDQLQRDAARLAELEAELSFALLMPLLGPDAASERMAPIATKTGG
jgi:AcrR family transcriptional regulator